MNYLLHQCDQHEHDRDEPEGGAEGYFLSATERGEPDGVWFGDGLDELGLDAGGTADEATVRAVFGRWEHPETGERLGRPPRRFKTPDQRFNEALAAEPDADPERIRELRLQSRQGSRQAVGYYDLTFSPPKSYSVYFAGLRQMGRTEDAERVWAAHREGVTAAMEYLQREAGYVRTGYHGRTKDGRSVGDYAAARQWVGVRFDHHTNRDGEPQLHSHVGLLNKAQAETDRGWRSLDGKALYQEKALAASLYERTAAAALERALPVRVAMRPDGKALEIVGVSAEAKEAFSSPRARVVGQVEAWAAEYAAKHGREPSQYERTVFAQAANLHDRPAKSEEVLTAQQRDARWSALRDVSDEVATAEAHTSPEAQRTRERLGQDSPGLNREQVIAAGVGAVQAERASWTRAELAAAIGAALPDGLGLGGAEYEQLLAGLVDEATAPGNPAGVLTLTAPEPVAVPSAARRVEDGRPAHRPHRDERYATEAQLSAEERLRATAGATGAPVVEPERLAALEAELTARGLGDDQRAAVLGVLGSGRRGDVLIGPAGAGKSYTVAALAEAWGAEHGPVLGLATGQNAANVLAEEGLPSTLNVAAFLTRYEPHPQTGQAREQLPAGALLVVDETGMSATAQLDRVRRVADTAGAKLLFTGDHDQLDSVGAGGALRMLAGDRAYELGEVRRFAAEWEAEASLALRRGDRDGLQAYEQHGRIYDGEHDEMAAAAQRAYLADTLAGRSSLLLVGSNAEAAELAARVRGELVRLGRVAEHGTRLRDATTAGVGDLVQTREGAWHLQAESGRAVANRDVWQVLARQEDGGLRVQLAGHPDTLLTLPARYVGEQVTLAYASTSHAAQGRTVDTGHALVDVSMDRGELYPNMTRGRERNTAYVITHAPPEAERGGESLHSDRFAVLSEVLDRDTAQRAALDVIGEDQHAMESVAYGGAIWQNLVSEQARERYRAALAEVPQVAAAGGLERLDAEPGAERLWTAARSAELDGHNPAALLQRAAGGRELVSAHDMGDTLRHRLRHQLADTTPAARDVPLWWSERTPAAEGELGAYARELAEHLDARQRELGHQAANDPPEWAREHLGPVPDDPMEQASWSIRAGVVAGYRELRGLDEHAPTALGAAPPRSEPEHRAAWNAAYTALGAPEAGRDYAAAQDGELQAMVDRHAREREWAPEHVGEALQLAEQRHARFWQRAVLERAEADAVGDVGEAEQLRGRADRHDTLAASLAEHVDKLGEVQAAREQWHQHTSASRQDADAAAAELARRHPEPAPVDTESQRDERPREQRPDVAERAAQSPEVQRPAEPSRDTAEAVVEAPAEEPRQVDERAPEPQPAASEGSEREEPPGEVDDVGERAPTRLDSEEGLDVAVEHARAARGRIAEERVAAQTEHEAQQRAEAERARERENERQELGREPGVSSGPSLGR